jgi:hypothetical protein
MAQNCSSQGHKVDQFGFSRQSAFFFLLASDWYRSRLWIIDIMTDSDAVGCIAKTEGQKTDRNKNHRLLE